MHEAVSAAQHVKKPRRQGHMHEALAAHFEHAVASVKDADSRYRLVIQAEPGQAIFKPKSIIDDEFLIQDRRYKKKKKSLFLFF